MDFWQRYQGLTARIVDDFADDPKLHNLKTLEDSKIQTVLLEAGHISTLFCFWLERALDAMQGAEGKNAISGILADERPEGLPSHQDDRVADLRHIGISDEQLGTANPSLYTAGTIANLFRLIDCSQDHAELRTLVAIQIYGELLAGEFYRVLCLLLDERFGLKESGQYRSRFYWPHFRHDRHEAGDAGHAAYFNAAIKKLLVDEDAFQAALEAATRAQATRLLFLEQFK